MLQSRFHLAIIMDGNGRWAKSRGLPRTAGHIAGATALREIVECAPDFGVTTLTLYAFSADNWKRAPAEVDALMQLLTHHLRQQQWRCLRNGIRLSVIGRRDRLSLPVLEAIEDAEYRTAACCTMHLRLAIDYSARDAIVNAAQAAPADRAAFTASSGFAEDVDLLIRTGGEQRLSDFLLWECAYAELYFTPTHWPDYTPTELAKAMDWFTRRERRFGAIPAVSTPMTERWLR